MKLWGGRFTENTLALVEQYTASIEYDHVLAEVDILGSIAHARMLGHTEIIKPEESREIIAGLEKILVDAKEGKLDFQVSDEDIHMNVERILYERIGSVAGKLHTARSRNDQVALDMHLYMRQVIGHVIDGISDLEKTLITLAEQHIDTLIPGYTHLQRAQPILLAHHLLAYFWMLERDKGRFKDALERTDMMPLGAGALAGTTFPIDRHSVQDELGFAMLYENSLDAVSDRDYLLEFLSASSILMVHLSRLSEELVLWSSEEFGFIELADAYCTGSSMMPQKKNPDVPEVIRGKSGRVFGHLVGLLTVLKGLPLAYNKDLQEDKEGVFDTIRTLLPALTLFSGMLSTMRVREDKLSCVFDHDFSNATDLADYLVKKGMPFREAHAVVGRLVLRAISENTNLLNLPIAVYQEYSLLFADDVYEKLDPAYVANARSARGGTGKSAVMLQIQLAKERCFV